MTEGPGFAFRHALTRDVILAELAVRRDAVFRWPPPGRWQLRLATMTTAMC